VFIYKGLRDPPFGHSSFYRSICFITIIINNGFKGISHYYNFFSYNYVWQPLFPVTPSFPVFGLLTLPPVSFPGVLNEFLQQLNCRSTRTSGYRDYKEKELSPIRQYPQSVFENSQKKAYEASPYKNNMEFKRPYCTQPIRVTHPRLSQRHLGDRRHRS